ncbi:hypothetical protein Hypma_011234 [Hypsizygus marmoreus]|uniref:Uncharacterized protein n=1 Tax=Hypsizygus marmoreus TaxID=39966 RepID=A0A369JHM4_HYPMA|nr:hypothetical protein Hypma_011234 [Hypsizygus marmoreus]
MGQILLVQMSKLGQRIRSPTPLARDSISTSPHVSSVFHPMPTYGAVPLQSASWRSECFLMLTSRDLDSPDSTHGVKYPETRGRFCGFVRQTLLRFSDDHFEFRNASLFGSAPQSHSAIPFYNPVENQRSNSTSDKWHLTRMHSSGAPEMCTSRRGGLEFQM